jgi:signal transduction histidine kinase
MRVSLKNSSGVELFNEFTTECNDCIGNCTSQSIKAICPIFNDNRRIGKVKDDNGQVFCCSLSKDDYSSAKLFKTKLDSYKAGLKEIQLIKEKLNIETQTLIHNLTSTNGHNIQELYAVVPQDLLTEDVYNQLENIQRIITANPIESAKAFLRIAKNNAAMKVEFSVINKLMDGGASLQNRRHPVKKVTLNLLHLFFQDFKEKNVYVRVEDNYDYLIFDYDIIHVALYHLLLNATKYIKQDSTLNVKFSKDEEDFYIILDMISIRIEENEKHKLLEEGFSGINAKKLNKDGKGLGLGITAKILALNNAELIISGNTIPSKSTYFSGVHYDNNLFKIKFKDYVQQQVS